MEGRKLQMSGWLCLHKGFRKNLYNLARQPLQQLAPGNVVTLFEQNTSQRL